MSNLKMPIYGLVQASRIFWELFSIYLKACRFKVSRADCCLFFCQTELGIRIFLYVDDACILGTPTAIQKGVRDVQKKFSIKIEGNLKDYLGCRITQNKGNKTKYINQPSLSNIEKICHNIGVQGMDLK